MNNENAINDMVMDEVVGIDTTAMLPATVNESGGFIDVVKKIAKPIAIGGVVATAAYFVFGKRIRKRIDDKIDALAEKKLAEKLAAMNQAQVQKADDIFCEEDQKK